MWNQIENHCTIRKKYICSFTKRKIKEVNIAILNRIYILNKDLKEMGERERMAEKGVYHADIFE